jgi:hypothetical protein
MKLQKSLLMGLFGLLRALSAQSGNIRISSLPFAITAPGTYVLMGNLTPPSASNAITIDASVTGRWLSIRKYLPSPEPVTDHSQYARKIGDGSRQWIGKIDGRRRSGVCW